MSKALELPLLGVSVGMPQRLAEVDGQPVISAILKAPVQQDTLWLGRTNLAGDAQANLDVHGGVDKAVYAYPAAHADWWAERGVPYRPGFMGENLTLAGADETHVRIGDRFAWGDATLEVSEPRAPCFKFALMTGRPEAPQAMTLSGHCGWYMRVLAPAMVPVRGTLVRKHSDADAPTIRQAFLIRHRPQSDPGLLARTIAHPALAQSWRDSLMRAQDRLLKG